MLVMINANVYAFDQCKDYIVWNKIFKQASIINHRQKEYLIATPASRPP